MNLFVCRSFAYLSIALALTSVIELPGSCQQKKLKRVAHPPVTAPKKVDAFGAAFEAAYTGDLVKIKGIVPSGGGIRMQDKGGKTLLHHAVLGGRMAVVQWLVSQKIPLDTTDTNGVSALALARQSTSDSNLEERRVEIINFLQEQGAQEIGVLPRSSGNDEHAVKPVERAEATPAPTGDKALFQLIGKSRSEVEGALGAPTKVRKEHRYFFLPGRPAESTSVDICAYESGPNKLPVEAAYVGQDMRELYVFTDVPNMKQWKTALTMIGADTTPNTKLDEAFNLSPVPGLPTGFYARWGTKDKSENPKKWFLLFTVQESHKLYR